MSSDMHSVKDKKTALSFSSEMKCCMVQGDPVSFNRLPKYNKIKPTIFTQAKTVQEDDKYNFKILKDELKWFLYICNMWVLCCYPVFVRTSF